MKTNYKNLAIFTFNFLISGEGKPHLNFFLNFENFFLAKLSQEKKKERHCWDLHHPCFLF
jgi:hypothetical protein